MTQLSAPPPVSPPPTTRLASPGPRAYLLSELLLGVVLTAVVLGGVVATSARLPYQRQDDQRRRLAARVAHVELLRVSGLPFAALDGELHAGPGWPSCSRRFVVSPVVEDGVGPARRVEVEVSCGAPLLPATASTVVYER